MRFDVVRFLDDNSIPWWPPGSINVSRDHVGIQCPFCDDDYNHMGLEQTGKKKPYCWKCGGHSWPRLVRALTGGSDPKPVFEEYGDILTSLYDDAEGRHRNNLIRPTQCQPPGSSEFKPAHKTYLETRGFDAEYLIRKYDLRVTAGADIYPYRIIFPIKFNGKTVSYQGRTYVDAKPKYLTARPEDEVVFHKDIFFNLDNANKDSVVVTEGVFDVMRLGDNSIASFGTAISLAQINLLARRFRKVFFLYDGEDTAQDKARKAALTLQGMGVATEIIRLDSGDPGELNEDDALHLKRELNLI
jgi:hypothetical protein